MIGYKEVVETLVNGNANVNCFRDVDGTTPLHISIVKGSYYFIIILILIIFSEIISDLLLILILFCISIDRPINDCSVFD